MQVVAEDRSLAALTYGVSALLPIVGPWIVYLASKGGRPFVAAHARRAALDSVWIHLVFGGLIAACIVAEGVRLYREASAGADVDAAILLGRTALSPWTLASAAVGALLYWSRLAIGARAAARGEWPR